MKKILSAAIALPVGCALLALALPKPAEQLPGIYPIEIYVGPDKEVRVTIPNIAKADLVDIISTFFSKGDEKAKTNFSAVIGKASVVTFVLTTKTPEIGAVTYTVKTPVWETTNAIEVIPDHEKATPSCTLIRYIQNGRTNEFHAWAVPVVVTTNQPAQKK